MRYFEVMYDGNTYVLSEDELMDPEVQAALPDDLQFKELKGDELFNAQANKAIESGSLEELPVDKQKMREYQGQLAKEQMERDIKGVQEKAAWQSAVEKTKLPMIGISPVEVAYPISVNQAYTSGYEAPSIGQGALDAAILGSSVLPPIRGGSAGINFLKNTAAQGLLAGGQEAIQSQTMDREFNPLNVAIGTGLGTVGAGAENIAIRRLGESFGNQPASIKVIESMDFSKLTKDNASNVIQNELNKQLGKVPVDNTPEFREAIKNKIANVIESNWRIKKPGFTKRSDVDEMLRRINSEVESIMLDTPRLTTKQLENLVESEDLYEQLLAKKSREAAADVTQRPISNLADVRNLQKALGQSTQVSPFKLPMIGTEVSPEILRYGRVLTAARPVAQNLPPLQR